MRKLAHQQGMTLIEMMVSMVIGMFLILGAVTVYTQGRQNYQTNEHIARLQENLRFAMSVLEPDVRLAGYWGLTNRIPDPDAEVAGLVVTCDGNDVTDWALDVGFTIEAFNNIPLGDTADVMADCAAFGDGVVANTDILLTRHASAVAMPLNAGSIQLESGIEAIEFFDDGNEPPEFLTVDAQQKTIRDLVVNVWYISADSDSMAGVPSLRRRTLNGNEMVDEEVIAGVENMQIQFGIDTDATVDASNRPNIERYVDAEDPLLSSISTSIVSMRLQLLVRATDAEQGHVERGGNADWEGYVPLDGGLAAYKPTDNFRRVQASKTIYVRNFVRPDDSTRMASAADTNGAGS